MAAESLAERTSPTSRRLGAAIRKRRLENAMTQEELSSALSISRPVLSALENGAMGQTRLLIEAAEAIGLEIFALPREDRRAREISFELQEAAQSKQPQRVRRAKG